MDDFIRDSNKKSLNKNDKQAKSDFERRYGIRVADKDWESLIDYVSNEDRTPEDLKFIYDSGVGRLFDMVNSPTPPMGRMVSV